MAKWIDIGPESQFPDGTVQCVTAGDYSIAVCRSDGTLAAMENACPHAGLPLDDAQLCGRVLTCINHGYCYDMVTGKNIDFPDDGRTATLFPVRINEEGHIEVNLSNE